MEILPDAAAALTEGLDTPPAASGIRELAVELYTDSAAGLPAADPAADGNGKEDYQPGQAGPTDCPVYREGRQNDAVSGHGPHRGRKPGH